MRVVLAIWLVAVATVVAVPAMAAETPAQALPALQTRAQKRVTAAHYPTLEKMLRRFSRQAGEARTRG
jgi:hypothetical protein